MVLERVDVVVIGDAHTLQARYAAADAIEILNLVFVPGPSDLPAALKKYPELAAVVAADSPELQAVLRRVGHRRPIADAVAFTRLLTRLDPDALPPPEELWLMVYVLAPLED